MNKSDLQHIIAIAEENSLSKAARKLYISQPALSKCLHKMEMQLGEQIFLRTPSGLILTYAGECFLNYAYKLLKLYNDMEMEFSEINNMKRGRLNLGITTKLGTLVLPNVLPKYRQQYPHIALNIEEATSTQLIQKLALGTVDIAVIWVPVHAEQIRYQTIFTGGILLALPKEHPLNAQAYEKDGKQYLDIRLAQDYPLILTDRATQTRQVVDRIIQLVDGSFQIALTIHNIETVIELVSEGMGISIVPEVYSKYYDKGDRINYYCIEEEYSPTWGAAVAYSSELPLTKPAKELLRMISETRSVFWSPPVQTEE